MSDNVYYQLREILDKMPNGFPATSDGLEIRILKKIFTEEEAGIAALLKMKYETAEAVAARTGRDTGHMKNILAKMADQGQIFGVKIGEMIIYKLAPFVFGIFEFQINRIDRELAEMVHEYFYRDFGKEFYGNKPALMKVVPIEKEIPHDSVVNTYESVTGLIESAKSWAVGECICKKEMGILGDECTRPTEVCMAIAPLDHYFDNYFWGRPISKEEAFRVVKMAEDAGLVHMTSNYREGHIYICNCCSCCCNILRGLNELNQPDVIARSNYRALVDEATCTGCGVCLDRCQARAIDMDGVAAVNERCIGCGLCASGCPSTSITMVRRDESEIEYVPRDDKDWNRKRAKSRGREDYKELLK
jgi:electron transport complex protein RnfB